MAKYEKFKEWMLDASVVTSNGEKGVVISYDGDDVYVAFPNGTFYWYAISNLEFLKGKEETSPTIPWEGCQIDWQVGQVVWDVRKGQGVVAKVCTEDLEYPVIVEFDNGGVHTYTAEGKILLDDLHRSLYFSEPEIVAETMPPKKPFVPKLKEGDKVAIFHVFGVDWEIVTVLKEEEDKLYFKYSNGVKDYCGKEHICVKLLGEEIKWD